MKLNGMLPFRTALCGLSLLALTVVADDGLYNEYCSSQNTGSGAGPYYDIYNSMGLCSTKCQDKYAFAVLQGKNCWCSNYIPADQTSTSDCSSQCPGYPSDVCGNPGKGLYGYLPLAKAPLGTAGQNTKSSSPTKAPDRANSDVSPAVTKTVTEEQSQSPSVVVSYVTPTLSSSSSMATTTTRSLVLTKVTTISGNLVTETVTSTPIGASPNNASSNPPALERSGLSDGAIAGVVIGTLIGIILVAVVAFLLWRRRRNTDPEGGSGGSPKRKSSVLSKAGLLGGAARPQSMSETNYDDPYAVDPVTGSNSVRHSMMFGAGAAGEGVAPVGPLGSSSDSGSDKRLSKPLVYDQRLNPSALWTHHNNNSQVSMQDQQDYSRPLGVINPDSARSYSFDSR